MLSLKHSCPLHVWGSSVRMFILIFILNAGELEQNVRAFEMAIKSYILQSIYLMAVLKLAHL